MSDAGERSLSARAWLAAAALALLAACAPASAPAQARPAAAGVPLPSAAPASEPAATTLGAVPPSGPYAPGWDVLHYDVEIALPEGAGWIAGRTTVRAARTTAAVASLPLDLIGLAVTGIRVGGSGVQFTHANGKVTVPVGMGRVGDTVEVEVTYAGTPDDGLVIGKTVGGQPSAFADNWPDRARYWFPSIDHPADKATVAFTVHAPAAWQVVSNGVMTGAPVATPAAVGGAAGARRTWRWRTDVAIPTYTMVIGATALAADTVGTAACGQAPRSPRADRCVAVTTWLYPEDRQKGAASFRRAALMLDLFAHWIGPFPYEKLAHVQSSTRYGGMENVAAIFYDEKAIAQGRDIESTVAHETAHQWFGDSVTEADWRHLWLSEGFATYFAALFYQWTDGEAAFRREMDDARAIYLRSEIAARPVIDPQAADLFGLLNANNYQKGSWILHMLRGVVGDSAFHAGIRSYYASHRDATALTADIQAAMEHASGRELGWFFEQWLTRPGYPMLRVTRHWDPAAREVVVDVEQTQPAGWPRFRIPTTLLVRGPWGERRQAIELTGTRTTVRVAEPAEADTAIVDPDGWVLAVGDPAGSGVR
ncbi:MAG: M1 family peptidase [Gemmatimonadetes bacterium]|nr:M1 family peptidase [Gemmatimonadota bacterium]